MTLSKGAGHAGRMRPASSGLRVTCALLGGAVVGAIASLFMLS